MENAEQPPIPALVFEQEQSVPPFLPEEGEHNNAYDSPITRGPAKVFEWMARPLNEYIYGPLTRKNRMLGMVVANATLTAPRLLEPLAGEHYIQNLRHGNRLRAAGWLGVKAGLKVLDGIDGPVMRANGITSLFGAGFDPLTDMIGTKDDGKRIKQAYEQLGMQDGFTDAVVDARIALDAGAILVGGIANTAAAKYAESKGITVPARDKPKANAEAKAKYTASGFADAILLAGTLFKSRETIRKYKKVGVGLLVASVGVGIVSLIKYGSSARRNIQSVKNREHEEDHRIQAGPYEGYDYDSPFDQN